MTNLPALPVSAAGQLANRLAAANVFTDYKAKKAANTLSAHADNLRLFAHSLSAFMFSLTHGRTPDEDEAATLYVEAVRNGVLLFSDPAAWAHITHGQLKAFEGWLLNKGYSIATINAALSHVRIYAQMAWKAGVLPENEAQLIAAHRGIKGNEGRNVDDKRGQTRVGAKKARFNVLTSSQIAAILAQPATPRGRRNAVLLTTLLYCGLRASELAGMRGSDVDMIGKRIHVVREKVKGTEREHGVYSMLGYPDMLAAYMVYMSMDAPKDPNAYLMRGAKANSPDLSDVALTRVTVSQLVAAEGRRIGIPNLSAHDLRHTGATMIARHDNNVIALRDWGGWSNLAMPNRYVQREAIANDQVTWGREDA